MGGSQSSCATVECFPKMTMNCLESETNYLGHLFLGPMSRKCTNSRSKKASEILTSKVDLSRERQVLRCLIQLTEADDKIDTDDVKINGAVWVFCWVSNEGTLHHHYTYEECETKNMMIDHVEQTYTGDAFVLYRVAEKENLKNHPTTIQELYSNVECSIVCSYRLDHALDVIAKHHSLTVQPEHKKNTKKKYTVNVDSNPQPDDEYRVIVRPPIERDSEYQLPPFTESWEIQYEFLVPPLPREDLWDPHFQTLYVWGDLDFAQYDCSPIGKTGNGDNLRNQLHSCTMNQIVPQVMIGRCLSANHKETFTPSWNDFHSWVIQAQYFWQTETSEPRALCGPIISVNPGELLRTCIRYDASSGNIYASIEVKDETKSVENNEHNNKTDQKESPETSSTGPFQRMGKYISASFTSIVDNDRSPENKAERITERKSEIIIPKPFMHNPSLFTSWRDFFEKCQTIEKQLLLNSHNRQKEVVETDESVNDTIGSRARPGLCVEYKGRVSVDVMKSLCPFEVTDIKVPGISPADTPIWRTELFCPRMGHISTLSSIDGISSMHLQSSINLAGKSGGIPTTRLSPIL